MRGAGKAQPSAAAAAAERVRVAACENASLLHAGRHCGSVAGARWACCLQWGVGQAAWWLRPPNPRSTAALRQPAQPQTLDKAPTHLGAVLSLPSPPLACCCRRRSASYMRRSVAAWALKSGLIVAWMRAPLRGARRGATGRRLPRTGTHTLADAAEILRATLCPWYDAADRAIAAALRLERSGVREQADTAGLQTMRRSAGLMRMLNVLLPS